MCNYMFRPCDGLHTGPKHVVAILMLNQKSNFRYLDPKYALRFKKNT